MGKQDAEARWLAGHAKICEEVAAGGNVVFATVLRPDGPHWIWGTITVLGNNAACLCCLSQPCNPVAGVVVIHAESGSMGMPMPYCTACADLQSVRQGCHRVLMDLFPPGCALRIVGS
jgi:hypothetical protein